MVVDHELAAVIPAKAMAMTVVDLLWNGAREARRVKAEAGPKLSREDYLALVRRFVAFEEYPGTYPRSRGGFPLDAGRSVQLRDGGTVLLRPIGPGTRRRSRGSTTACHRKAPTSASSR